MKLPSTVGDTFKHRDPDQLGYDEYMVIEIRGNAIFAIKAADSHIYEFVISTEPHLRIIRSRHIAPFVRMIQEKGILP